MFNRSRTVVTAAAVVVMALAGARAAHAGQPLLCHPFETGGAPLLPWSSGHAWQNPDRSYDVQQLTGDVLRLLTPDAPVLARMENMRRATIYASQDDRVARALLTAVLGRTAQAPRDALAWFDAGYLVETYRQASGMVRRDLLAGTTHDGYSLVQKAIGLAGGSPDMEFAASLMQRGDAVAAEHRRRAETGARAGSLLARNLGL